MVFLLLLRLSSLGYYWPRALTVLHTTSSLSYDRPVSQFLQRCNYDRFLAAFQVSVCLAASLPHWLAGRSNG